MNSSVSHTVQEQDIFFMRRALALAEKGRGRTSPNPMVGAVVVKDGVEVGSGYHQKAGTPHAEVHALRAAGEAAAGATLYVTLEPCCHHGRTGPCTEAIIAAGIKRVVAAMVDPNPKVAGKGLVRLQEAGIEVTVGVLEEEARRLNEIFIKYITTGRPFVLLKAAVSLDGKIATRTGDARWITGEEARLLVHRWRDHYDAVLVGVNTVLRDDPRLTTRLPEGGRDPVRVILDSTARTPPGARVIRGGSPAPVVIAVTERAPRERVEALRAAGAEVWELPAVNGRVALEPLLMHLAERGWTSLLVEGGGEVHAAFLSARLVDKVAWFIAPLLIGGREAPGAVGGEGAAVLAEAVRLQQVRVERVGEDLLVEGYPVNDTWYRQGTGE